jgi:hypothetical protein
MRSLAILVVLLAAATGCSSPASRPAATPVAQATEVGSDPSWNPPSEMELSISESSARPAPKTEIVNTLHIPKQEKPHGAVHAATY